MSRGRDRSRARVACSALNRVVMSGQNSGTGQRVKMKVTTRLVPAQVGVGEGAAAFVDQRERRDRVAALEARGWRRRVRLDGDGSAPAGDGHVFGEVGPDPTRSRNRTRSPGASRTDSSASVNAIVIAGM